MENDELEQILARVARKEGAKNDAQIASALGVSRSSLPTWRARNSIPYRALFEYANRSGVSLDWLFMGGAGVSVAEPSPSYKAVPDNQGFEDRTERLRQASKLVMAIAEEQPETMDAMSLGPVRDLAYRAGLSEVHLRDLFDLLHRSWRGEFWLADSVAGIDVSLLTSVIRAVDDAGTQDVPVDRRAAMYAEIYAYWTNQRGRDKELSAPTRENVLPFVKRA